MSASERVVICGGGIVGASIAYHLSLRGVAATVIEQTRVAAAASGKAGGFLAGGWGDGPTEPLHTISFKMHEELAQTLGIESYRKLPTLQVDNRRKGNAQPSWLDGKCSSTSMDTDTAQVTPLELTTKMMDAAVAAGAVLKIGAVTGIAVDGGGNATAVTLADGESIPCGQVVVAMGPWSCQLEDWLADGTKVPMTGIKSTSVVYDHAVAAQKVTAEPFALFCGEDKNGCHLEVYPRPDGSVYLCGIGGSDHVEGARLRPGGDCGSADKIEANTSRVSAAHTSLTAMAPSLTAGVEGPSKTQACMRPCPPDAMPMMGAVPSHDNIFLCCGHNCWGILWAPVTGKLMAELLIDGKTSTADIAAFSPARYNR